MKFIFNVQQWTLFPLITICIALKGTDFIFLHVFPGPDDCKGHVSCSVTPYITDEDLSDITVTLNDIPRDYKCVAGHKFSLAGQTKRVLYESETQPSATFTVSRNLGVQYMNSEICTYDAEDREGIHKCSFSITSEHTIPVF